MASNAFANAAAAVTAGYIKTNTDRGVAPIGAGNAGVYPLSERFQTVFSIALAGVSGEAGLEVRQVGYGVDQNTAELNALAALNGYRANRYGGDSAAVNAGVTGGAAGPIPSAAKPHTKDKT